MLEALRKSTGSVVIKILFVLLILSFGIWGVGDIVGSQIRNAPAITVGDVTVSIPAVQDHFTRQMARLRQIFGPEFTAESAKEMGMVQSVIADLSAAAARDMVAQDLGITASDSYLKSITTSHPAFIDSEGAFDRERFRKVLASYNMSETTWFDTLRRDVIHSRLETALTSGISVPHTLSSALYRSEQEQRTATVLHIPLAMQKVKASPTEDDLATLYESQKNAFLVPETRDIEALLIRLDSLKDAVSLNEEELRAAYETRQDMYHTPEHRRVSHVLVDDEGSAHEVFQYMQAGQSLEKAAAQANVGDPIDMGEVTRDGLPQDIAQAVWSHTGTAPLGPLHSSVGWHVFSVGPIVPGSVQPFDAVRDDVAVYVMHTKATERLNEILPRIEDALAAGESYPDVAKQFSIDIFSASALPKDMQALAENNISLPADFAADLLLQAYTLEKPGDETRAIPVDAGALVVKLDRISPEKVRPLAEVRDRVTAMWTEEQRRTSALRSAKDIVDRLPKESIEILAKGIEGARVEVFPTVERSGTVEKSDRTVSQQILDALFSLKSVGSTTVTSDAENIQVVRLDSVIQPDPAQDPNGLASVSQRMENVLADDLLRETTDALLRRYNVDVNYATIESAL